MSKGDEKEHNKAKYIYIFYYFFTFNEKKIGANKKSMKPIFFK
jgi:hypothetical protein